ncbi:MAG: hypothetical protein MHMPM18_004343, partial [Marteilia pararefringens]
MMKASIGSQKQSQLLVLHENSKKSLDIELQKFREETQNQRKLIASLEREKERYISEASDLASKMNQYMNENRDKDVNMAQFKKQIDEFESKLQQQRSLYESARNDCQSSQKSLIELQEEIVRGKKAVRGLEQQSEALKEEIQGREVQLAREKGERQKAERMRESLRGDVQLAKAKLRDFQTAIDDEREKKLQLECKLGELERKLVDLGRENSKLTSAKDLFSAQLIRKTREVELLCEKIDIQTKILARGENRYKQKFDEIKALKAETKRLATELANSNKLTGNIKDEQQKVKLLEDQLVVERAALKAARTAAETPLNVHRWRKLEAEDPQRFELLKQTQSLQRLLIEKGKQLAKTDRDREECEK